MAEKLNIIKKNKKRNYTFKLNKPAFEINKKVSWIKLRIFVFYASMYHDSSIYVKKFPCKKRTVQSLMSNDIVRKRKYLYGRHILRSLLMKLDIELKYNQHQHISLGFLVHLKNICRYLSFNFTRLSPTTRYTFQQTVFFSLMDTGDSLISIPLIFSENCLWL